VKRQWHEPKYGLRFGSTGAEVEAMIVMILWILMVMGDLCGFASLALGMTPSCGCCLALTRFIFSCQKVINSNLITASNLPVISRHFPPYMRTGQNYVWRG
jgi:hypothetical protein